jgi:regulation of enolase protein 1 (concanavalin A-like superfamily)
VFTSTRQYGNTMNIPTAGVTTSTQLWVGALDDAVSAGADRSHPPFWLPNQMLGAASNRIRNERAYWVLDACRPSLANLNPPPPPSGPAFTWVDKDIGVVGSAGSASAAGGVFTVVASGDDIWNSNDAFHYVYMPVSGDFQFRARVTGLNWSDYWAKAGVMLRDNLASNSAEAMILLNAGQVANLQWRDPNGASSNYTPGPGEAFPYYVRLTRTGTTVVGDISPDGTNWTTVGTLTPAIGSNAYIGLAVTAHNNTTTTTATFDTVGFGAVPAPDPRLGSLCQDDSDCCDALVSPATAACRVDTPITNPVTRHCMLLQANTCVALAGACVSDSDCCGFPSNTCVMGSCQLPPSPLRYPEIVFTRDYVASCAAPLKPVWRFFDWQTVTPGDSSIKFSAADAKTAGALPSTSSAASVVYLGTASGAPITSWVGADVGAALVAGMQYPSFSYLRIFVDFKPTSDKKQGPTLTSWRQKYDCVASE